MSGCTHEAALGRPPAKGPLTVNVTCDQDVSIGLVDAARNQAWAFEAKAKDPVEWQVGANVTSIDIQPKDAANPLPLDSTPHGNGSGKAAKSTIKDGAAKGTYAYQIVVTCQPSASGSAPIKITIDPDMIII
ncbi:hypothetical protein BH11GEM1_BH11GEM1_36170 [soil metagenome]